MGDKGLGVALEELLSVRHVRRVNGVGDGRPERTADEDESQGRPEGVRDEAHQDIAELIVDVEAAVRGEDHADEGEVDESQMEDCHVVEEDTPKAAEHALASLGVALVEGGAEGSGGLEGLRLATQPGGKDE